MDRNTPKKSVILNNLCSKAIFRLTQTGTQSTYMTLCYGTVMCQLSVWGRLCIGGCILCRGVEGLRTKICLFYSEDKRQTSNSRSILEAVREGLAISANKWPGLKFVRKKKMKYVMYMKFKSNLKLPLSTLVKRTFILNRTLQRGKRFLGILTAIFIFLFLCNFYILCQFK